MLTSRINFINFKHQKKNKKIKQLLNETLKNRNEVVQSLDKKYKNSYKINKLRKFKTSKNFKIIGMGGSTLGAQAIYDFLKPKIKKNFEFIDNLQPIRKKKDNKNSYKAQKSYCGATAAKSKR